MINQSEIYRVLLSWIEIARLGDFKKFNELRSRFGQVEIGTFGEVPERIKNPRAMQYDRVRNELVRYSGDKDPTDLRLAIEDFSRIPKPVE